MPFMFVYLVGRKSALKKCMIDIYLNTKSEVHSFLDLCCAWLSVLSIEGTSADFQSWLLSTV